MGTDLARDLLRQGWKVGCLDVNEAAGQKLVSEYGDQALFVKCNVGDYDSQGSAFAAVFDTWGRIDALLANAGIVDRSSVYILEHRNSKALPPAPDVSTTTVDYLGVVYGTQLAIHFMRQNPTPGGQIVATASKGPALDLMCCLSHRQMLTVDQV
jgi:NAD(P)-dependent dehydrogenase (short-subunit alcohol dehydrogenase family)